MKQQLVILVTFVLATLNVIATEIKTDCFKVEIAGKLPQLYFGYDNEGYAGTFSGIIDDKLFLAGGANYPETKPWEGGMKIFNDKIYVFDIVNDTLISTENIYSLPYSIAYGASVSLPEGILCIGGNNSDQCFSSVFLMRWDHEYQKISFFDYPELPVPLSYASAVLLKNKVYVIGGSSSVDGEDTGNHFYMLDLSEGKTEEMEWKTLPAFPGKGRIFSVTVVQSNGSTPCIYLFSGRNVDENRRLSVFRDGLVFNPESEEWQSIATNNNTVGFPVMGGAAFPFGRTGIVFIGGSSGDRLIEEQEQRKQLSEIIRARDTAAISVYKKERVRYYFDHTGFSKDIMVFNTVDKTMTKAGEFDSLCPIMTSVNPYKKGVILASGEIKPGLRTPNIFWIERDRQPLRFNWWYPGGILFFCLIVGIPTYLFVRRQRKYRL